MLDGIFQTFLGLFNSFIGVPYYFQEFQLVGIPHSAAVRVELFPKLSTGTVPQGVTNICDAKAYLFICVFALSIFFKFVLYITRTMALLFV